MVPGSPFLTFKVCLSDIKGFLSNHKIAYDYEDFNLSCGLVLLNLSGTFDSPTIGRFSSIHEAFVSRGFVHTASFDTIDCFAKLNRAKITNSNPRISLNLYLGLLNVHSCRDSFQLLSSVIGEWWNAFSSPSEEELEKMKLKDSMENSAMNGSYDEKDKQSQVEETNLLKNIQSDMFSLSRNDFETSKSNDVENVTANSAESLIDVPDNELSASQLREKYKIKKENTEVNLAKSLLIQDYYTMDTENIVNSQVESSRKRSPSQKLNREIYVDEWTDLDENWLSFDISPEKDHRAMWFPTFNGGKNNSLQEKVKPLQIYPTHIPISCAMGDPLADGKQKLSLIVVTVFVRFYFFFIPYFIVDNGFIFT